MVSFKQKCMRCKKKYVMVTGKQRFAICYDCQKDELNKEIKDPVMKELFNIPEDFYAKNSFLRDIKLNYLKYEKLSEKQINAFKNTVKNLKDAPSTEN